MGTQIDIVSKNYLSSQLSKYHNDVIKTKYAKKSEISSGSGTSSSSTNVSVVDLTNNDATSFNILPNTFYNLGSRTSLTLNFVAPNDESKLAIYYISFSTGTTANTPVFKRNGTIISIDKGNSDFIANTKYEVSYNWQSQTLIVQ